MKILEKGTRIQEPERIHEGGVTGKSIKMRRCGLESTNSCPQSVSRIPKFPHRGEAESLLTDELDTIRRR